MPTGKQQISNLEQSAQQGVWQNCFEEIYKSFGHCTWQKKWDLL
jgi:hypothetical protein